MSKTQGDSARQSAGLFSALKGVTATVLATGRTRLELLGNEIEEEKLRAIRLVVMAQAMMFCLGVGVLLAVALIAVLFWDSRVAVIGASAGIFLLLGAFFYRAFQRLTERPEPVFAASLAELQEDLRQLKATVRNESAAD